VVESSVICLPTPRCGIPMDKGCTQPLSSDPNIKLEYHSSSLYHNISFVRNLHKLQSLTPYASDHNQNQSKNTHKREQSQQQHAQKQRQEWNNKTTELQLRNMLKSLSNHRTAWSRSLIVVVCSWNAWCSGRGAQGPLL
jgi:hypothetical protein